MRESRIPNTFKTKETKPNGEPWRYGEKIALISYRTSYYHFIGIKNKQFIFIRGSLFWRRIQKRKIRQNKDRESILLTQEINNIKLKKGCEICCYNSSPAALQFHHSEPHKKAKSISDLLCSFIRAGKIRRILIKNSLYQEMELCKILCSNCHLEVSYKEKSGADKLKTHYIDIEDYLRQNKKDNKIQLSFFLV